MYFKLYVVSDRNCIPGHGSELHNCVSVLFPGQPSSVSNGFEALHNRMRYVVPPPHEREHTENEVQLLQLPAVYSANYEFSYYIQ